MADVPQLIKQTSSVRRLCSYALQSTVRFLYANRISRKQIEEYFNRWQELAPETTLAYFSVENPSEHFDAVIAERGDEWSSKLYSYVEQTPIDIVNGLHGKTGFIEFWSNYQQLCLELLDAALISVHPICTRSWEDSDLEALATRAGFIPKRQ